MVSTERGIDAVVGDLLHLGGEHDDAARRDGPREADEARLVDAEAVDAVHQDDPGRARRVAGDVEARPGRPARGLHRGVLLVDRVAAEVDQRARGVLVRESREERGGAERGADGADGDRREEEHEEEGSAADAGTAHGFTGANAERRRAIPEALPVPLRCV